MQRIITQYPSPEITNKTLYSHPVFTMDLHGFSQNEAHIKIDYILEYSNQYKTSTFQIITGIGSGVLRDLVRKKLQQWKKNRKIETWKEKEDSSEENKYNGQTGVFLFIR